MREHRVALDGGATVTVEEAGEGPAILLMHAGVSERHMWDPLWVWLPYEFRVARWDWRGYGDTAHVPGPFSYADDVLRIMDTLGLERATLVGCSFAGAVGLQVTIEHHERVERLVAIGTGVPGFEGENPPAVDAMLEGAEAAFARDDPAAALALMEKAWLIGPRRNPEQVDAAYLARARELLARADRPDNGAAFADSDWTAIGRLHEIRVPTLVVVGDEDVPAIRQACELVAREVAGAHLETIAGAAHLPSLERPQALEAVLRAWLSATARSIRPQT